MDTLNICREKKFRLRINNISTNPNKFLKINKEILNTKLSFSNRNEYECSYRYYSQIRRIIGIRCCKLIANLEYGRSQKSIITHQILISWHYVDKSLLKLDEIIMRGPIPPRSFYSSLNQPIKTLSKHHLPTRKEGRCSIEEN